MNKLLATLAAAACIGLGFVGGQWSEPTARASTPSKQYTECAAVLLWKSSNPDYVKKHGHPAPDRRSPVPKGWDVKGASGGPSGNFMMVCH